MLTPVDIQQKKFHVGLGYDKKDVNTFFESVCESYEQLYRSNAELKEKVNVLTDTLQNYKSKENSLNKSLMRAEKDTEETLSKANTEAKNILRDAKIQAQNITGGAEERLVEIEDEIAVLEAKYAAYKSNFCTLMKKQFEFLGANDFDPKSYIDDRAWSLLGNGSRGGYASSRDDGSFGSFNGDPQMRDESTLSGGVTGGFNGQDVTSSSAVYTQNLAAGENFVDPFAPKKEKEYDPFEKKGGAETKSNLKVSNEAEDRKKFKRAPVGSAEASMSAEKAKEVAHEAPKREEKKVEPEKPKERPKYEPKVEVKPPKREEPKEEPTKEPEKEPEIPTVDFSSDTSEKEDLFSHDSKTEEDSFVGEVEDSAGSGGGAALIEETDDSADTDDDGFEFV